MTAQGHPKNLCLRCTYGYDASAFAEPVRDDELANFSTSPSPCAERARNPTDLVPEPECWLSWR